MKNITKKQKKAQMKMGETIAVLIVFFLLLFFGIFFYSGIEKRQVTQKISEIHSKSSIDMSQIITFLPELKCTSEDITQTLCLDNLKIEAFKEFAQQNSEYYQSVFGNTKIELIKIYQGLDYAQIAHNNTMLIYQGTSSENYYTTFIPVSIFYPLPYPGYTGIGMLKITYYTFG